MGMTNEQYQSIIRAILELLKDCKNEDDIQLAIRVIQAMQSVDIK